MLFFPSQMYSQLCPDTLLLSLLLLCIPATYTAKCPPQCICDQIQLTVTCVNKNLTQIPPTVDEVSYSHTHTYITNMSMVYLVPFSFHLICNPLSS